MSTAMGPSSVPSQTCPASVRAEQHRVYFLLHRNLHFKEALWVAEDMVCLHGNEGDVTGATSCFQGCSRWVGSKEAHQG